MIQLALSGTMSIFVFLFTFALVLMGFGVYLSNAFGIFLFWALLLLILFEVISLFAGTMTIMRKGFAFIGLLIFSLYVLYDTHTILQRNYFGDFITASLDYYLDIINIFLDVLTLNNN
jgi:FtsH-binding integral membrane protein